jgi:hypothetical protein
VSVAPVQDLSSRSCLASATESEPVANQHERAAELSVLLHQVGQARARLRQEDRSKNAFYARAPCREELLEALEAYAAALSAAGWPMNYRLRDELFLYRRLAGSTRPSALE